jgi:hypothetical protein
MRVRVLVGLVVGLLLGFSTSEALELDPLAEAKRLEGGLARLCGVWDWTVHSHTRNHREAKTKIVLPSAEEAGVTGPSPTEIRIYGDAVYFRWVFPGGFQEDSMLLVDDKRLEGTFRTSTGAVGAVNGKRLSSCQFTREGAPQTPLPHPPTREGAPQTPLPHPPKGTEGTP